MVGSEVDVSPCAMPRCSGTMRLKKNQKGFLLACTTASCKSVWWVPKFVRAGKAAEHTAYLLLLLKRMDLCY
jgi:hypothetical protein